MRTKENAFTLAEVLITIAIVGVVAAMTIPTLIQNYKKKVVETKLLKFYSTMAQAVKLSEIDNGPKEQWEELKSGYEKDENGDDDLTKPKSEAWVYKHIVPYLKGVKVDNSGDKTKIYFPDGSLAQFHEYAIYYFLNAGDSYNENKKDGINAFPFFFRPNSTDPDDKHHIGKGIEPYAHSWTDDDVNTLYKAPLYGCNNTSVQKGVFCTKLIQLNGWKIPSDYPYKF